MSERPNVILGTLIAAATVCGGLLTAGLVGLGGAGVLALTAMVIGAFSACIYFLAELHRVPAAPLLLVSLTFLSGAGLLSAALRYRRERRLLSTLPLEPLSLPTLSPSEGAGAAPVIEPSMAHRSQRRCVQVCPLPTERWRRSLVR